MFASGTFETSSDVRSTAAFGGKADVGCEPTLMVLAAFDPGCVKTHLVI